ADVRYYAGIRHDNRSLSADELKRLTFFVPPSSSANIVTYTDDGNRVRSFINALIAATGARPATPQDVDKAVAGLPFSVTETTLGDHGIERTTRSPLGQASSLLPLAIPQQVRTGQESK